MKVRLSDDMIRFRLNREDVRRLSEGESIFLSLDIAPTSLTVVLEPVAGAASTANSLGGLRVGLPSAWLENWPESELIGFDFDVQSAGKEAAGSGAQPTGGAQASRASDVIRIVVEKDFPCSHDGSAPPKPVRMT